MTTAAALLTLETRGKRAIEAYKLCSSLSEAELYQYKINEQEQADLHSCIIAGRTDLLDLLDEKDHEVQALKEQIQALQKELTQSRSSSTDLHH